MKTKATAAVMMMLFLAGFVAVAIPVEADPGIVLDGIISSGEWGEATSFALGPYTVFIMNDLDFMYVAFDYPVTTGSDFASFNTYKQDTFDPETINAPCVASWDSVWDTIVDENADDVPETWHREDPSTRYDYSVDTATEMKVPLTELGLSAGDSIKLMFVLNVHMVGTYVYPTGANSFDVTTYECYKMSTPVLPVSIDIKPGSCPNSINPNSKGVIPVAILTTLDFDATTVDPVTVIFADAIPLRWTIEDVWSGDDVSPDGDLDLLLFFKTQECELSGTSASLTGETFGGTPISGTGSINLVP